MKYVVASYSPIYSPHKVPFGLIINNGDQTYYYFKNDNTIQEKIEKVNPNFDKPTFINFKKTFEDTYITTGRATFTAEGGNKVEVDTNKGEFLNLLAQTYEGPYQYSEPKSVDGDDPTQTLDSLKRQLIESDS